MKNLTDLKKVQNFLNDEQLKRIDYSNKAHRAIEQSMEANKGESDKFIKNLDKFVNMTAQSASA